MRPGSALSRRLFLDSRVRTGSFALLFAIFGLANAAGYRASYKTLAERIVFAHSLGTNKALQLFYGVPHNLLTVGGYSAWRVGGFGSILAGAWGALAAVRALRAEEDAGRQELVLAGALGRTAAFRAAIAALLAASAVLWAATLAGLVIAGLPVGGSAFLALAMISPALVFAGVGAVASQLAGTQRLALQLASAVLAAAFLLRVVADLGNGLGWLRWSTPFGWSEELRAFADPEPAVLLLPLVVTALLLAGAGLVSRHRDVGRGLLATHDSAAPRRYLLSSPSAHALRSQLGVFAIWFAGLGLWPRSSGCSRVSFTNGSIPSSLQRELRKLGGATLTTPAGEIGLEFLFLVLLLCAVCLLAGRRSTRRRGGRAARDGCLAAGLADPLARRAAARRPGRRDRAGTRGRHFRLARRDGRRCRRRPAAAARDGSELPAGHDPVPRARHALLCARAARRRRARLRPRRGRVPLGDPRRASFPCPTGSRSRPRSPTSRSCRHSPSAPWRPRSWSQSGSPRASPPSRRSGGATSSRASQHRGIATERCGFLRMAGRWSSGTVRAMSFSLATTAFSAVSAALLMVTLGTTKKKLGWKHAPRRCSTCGRTDRYDCPCRR